jgi:peptide/nickel transport system substrate-binding protein
MQVRKLSRVLAIVMVLGLVGAACSKKEPTGGGATSAGGGQKGGSAIFGAEQWPQCLNLITACATSTWMQIVGPQPTVPKLLSLDDKSNVVASPLVMEVPSLANGQVVKEPFSVTYHLNPAAVWDDGTKITGDDVDFTLKAIINTTGTTGPVGYDKITSVETSGDTVKLNFSEPYADWQDLFGGGSTNGYVIKKAAFPDADPDKPDLAKEMNTIIPFSGGPWKMMSWSKSQEVLVRNDKFWGHQALLDQVTFIPLEEQPQEITALLSGTVDAIFPQAGVASIIDQLASTPAAKAVTGPTNYGDAFWFQLDDPVLKDFAVREAIAYGTDRQKIIDNIIKANNPTAEVLNCLPPLFPVIDDWCTPAVTAATSKYSYQPEMSISLLEGAGYDCSGVPDSPCTKGGQPLTITAYYTEGNVRRQHVGDIVKEGMRAAGIDWEPKPNDATDLFSNKLPKGDYQVIEYASGATVDPSPTSFSWLSTQIPTAENKYAGANYQHYRHPEEDALMQQMDMEVDLAARHALSDQVYAKIFAALPALPLYPFINITAWRTDKIAGPVGTWNQASYGTYYNMDEWYKVT